MSAVYLSLLLLVVGSLVPAVILLARTVEARNWQNSLVAFQLHPPTHLNADEVSAWLTNIAAMTHPPSRFALLPLPPVCVEVVSNAQGVKFFVLAAKRAEAQLLSGIRATMPGCRITEVPDYLTHRPRFQVAAELTMTSHTRQLAVDRIEAASTALLASLQPIAGNSGSEIHLQSIFTSAGTPAPVPTVRASRDNELAWSWENTLPEDAEAVRSARAKYRDAQLLGVVRAGVVAPTKPRALALFARVWNNWHSLNAPGVQLRRRLLPSSMVAERITNRAVPLVRWPLTVSAREAAGLLALPVGNVVLPGVTLGAARQLPPPIHMAQHGMVLGASNFPGMTNRQLALRTEDRLRHTFVLGPTGSGKSWLLSQMILTDIRNRHGVFVVDPKGDLINDVLSRIDDKDADRIVVLDASQREQPIGLNILGGAGGEAAKELLVDNVLHVFSSIWEKFWGPRSDSLCRAALTTLMHTCGVDGSAMTLCELVPLLTNASFRRFVVNQPGLPDATRAYWYRYDVLSDAARLETNEPLLRKVEAFTSRTPIRLMVGQSNGLDLRDIFRQRKAVLVSLAKGSLGAETANLLGSLLVTLLWQATINRVNIPPERRHACFAYIDEAADIMRLPVPLSDMFSQARGLGLGVVAAMQLISQAPEHVRSALLGTVRTQAIFVVERDDAVLLAQRFAPLTAEDLTGLARYEVAMRPCLDGVTHSPVTLTTLPLAAPIRSADELAARSRGYYGLPRADVEAALRARVELATSSTAGRRRRGGSA